MFRILHRGLLSIQRKLGQAHKWLSEQPVNPKGELFGLKDLELSLVLILFLFQVVLSLMGVQQNFWGALLCWLVITFLAVRIVWKWESVAHLRNYNKVLTSILIVGAIVYLVREPMTRTFYITVKKSFVFLVPGQELVECERRVFFVKHAGARVLSNPEITLWDNNAKRGDIAKYAEITPGEPDPAAPKYIWWHPAHPWDEDYTITVTTGDIRMTQRLVVRSTQGKLQLASEVSLNGTPVLRCRDPLLPSSYSLASGASEQCDTYMSIPKEITDKIEPETAQKPNGSLNIPIEKIKKLATSPKISGIEGQPESRHLWEYQKIWIASDLSKYKSVAVGE